MKTYVRINWLITIIIIIILINLSLYREVDTFGIILMFLILKTVIIDVVGTAILFEKDFYDYTYQDIKFIAIQIKNIIKFYLNL